MVVQLSLETDDISWYKPAATVLLGESQYSSARIPVRTRQVTAESVGSGEPMLLVAIVIVDLPEAAGSPVCEAADCARSGPQGVKPEAR
ncbi:hypothetical protein [Rhizobium leguminosarum]|uniref:hypothetical protein n=1 Tax=Rhizobium leguminosarum TaxID=384 RepID=UPI000518973D|nr:hypothetical protein [Rhizobium leguminosarum]